MGSGGVSRRGLLQGVAGAGLAAAISQLPVTATNAAASAAAIDWIAFDAAVSAEFARMGLVGGAVAVVSSAQVLHTHTLGVRAQHQREPVTNRTRFLVASTTKSMSSLLVATFVDDKKLSWDQPVIDAWPGFRAPTEHLTKTLRVRDLLGMASGIGEPGSITINQGIPTAAELLKSLVSLPVIAKPGKEFFYNNTVYAAGSYLPLLVQHVAAQELEAAYSEVMHRRVYQPAGMTTARIADDPRGLVSNYAAGNGLDLHGRAKHVPYSPVGSYAPVGGTLATLDDMAAYVRLQLRGGVSVTGRRVVSAANLAETHRPHIANQFSKDLDPDAVASGYCLGWIRERYNDGSSLVWHNGGIDGFTTFIGFFPEHDLGLVVLNNMDPQQNGFYFYLYVLNLLLNERFGLNQGVPAKVHAANAAVVAHLRELGNKSHPVHQHTLAPFVGYYEGGYQLNAHGHHAEVALGPRRMPLVAMPNGSYLFAGGILLGTPLKLGHDRDGTPHMELVGLGQTVRRTVGP